MSLINQMLKDLDTRKHKESIHSSQQVEVVACTPPKSNSVRCVVWGLVSGIVLCAGVGCWWLFSQPDVKMVQVPQRVHPQQQNEPIAIEVQAAAVIEPVVVTDSAHQEVSQLEPLAAHELPPPALISVLPKPVEVETKPEVNSVVAQARKVAREPVAKPSAVVEESTLSTAAAPMVVQPSSLVAKAQQLRVEGRAFVQQQRYHSGAQRLNQALELDHGSAQPWQELVWVYVQAGELSLAMDTVKRGRESYPNDIGLRVYHARLIVETGDYPSALAVLRSGEAPSVAISSDYYALLASVLQQVAQFQEAGECYALLLASYPQRGDWWIGRAISADQLGAAQQARAYYQQAMSCPQLNPQLKQFAEQQLTRLSKG